METSPARPQNMIDTTDALEAVSACQSMKNFLFTLILIGLSLCQIVFWMDHFGLVNKKGCSACKTEGPACPAAAPAEQCPQDACPKSKPQANAQNTGPVFLAATTEPVQQTKPVANDPQMIKNMEEVVEQLNAGAVAEAESVEPIEQAINEIVKTANRTQPEKEILLENEADRIPAEIPAEHATPEMLEPQPSPEEAEAVDEIPLNKDLFSVSCQFAAGVVAVCNFIVLAAAILYSLSLLICLKISLTGRLGGMNHITRAFFISLFLLVVLVPWQRVMPGVLVGSVWLPGELLCGGCAKTDTSVFWKVMLYLRFCGLCFVALWFLLWAQIRSAKWARATLRRLGVVR
ncbi:MAG: hypothetical protein ACYSOH_05695 [Planctomycetota bacterium]